MSELIGAKQEAARIIKAKTTDLDEAIILALRVGYCIAMKDAAEAIRSDGREGR